MTGKSSNTADFIKKAKKIHKDNFDYSLVEYIKNNIKVKIICNKCKNIIEQTPNSHLTGKGCKKCSNKNLSLLFSSNTEDFISKTKLVNGSDKYDYSLVEYMGANSKVKIICNKCKNIIEQTPNSHLRGYGCKECANKNFSLLYSSNKEEFISKAKIIHGNNFDYSLVEYMGANSKVKIICNKCKNIFEQTPGGHLTGYGCKECANKNLSLLYSSNKEEFISKAKSVHGSDNFDYSLVEYVGSLSKIKIICNKCKNIFEQTPSGHLCGYGCERCSVEISLYFLHSNFTKLSSSEGYLYLLKLSNEQTNEEFVKIGVTSRNIKVRIKEIEKYYKIEVLKFHKNTLKYISEFENKIHNYYRNSELKNKPKIKFGGHEECYKLEILNEIFSTSLLQETSSNE